MTNTTPRMFTLKDSRQVHIREATPADAPSMRELRLEIGAELAFTVTAPHECPSLEVMTHRLDAPRPGHVCLIATDGARVVGEVNLQPGLRERTRHAAELGLHVQAGYRAAGLGRALTQAAINAAHPSIEKIWLAVFADNAPAVALYKSLGFELEGRRVGQIRLGPGEYTDDLLMAFWRGSRTEPPEGAGHKDM